MAKYIDENGFAHFLGKLKTLLDGKVNTESGKGLSTNDYTTTEKNKLAGIADSANNYSLPTASADTKGGVKIGAGLTMTGEVLSADVQSVPVMTGATSSAAGTAGLVPAPGAGKQNYFLKGNGEWDSVNVTDEKVKVTTLSSSTDAEYPLMAVNNTSPTSSYTYGAAIPTSSDKRPKINGKTGVLSAYQFSGSGAGLTNIPASAVPVMTGATSSEAGTAGLVPAPGSTQIDRLLFGDGTWAMLAFALVPTSSGCQLYLQKYNPTDSTTKTITILSLPTSTGSSWGMMSPADKAKLDAFGEASTYALKSDITSMYKHKGSVSSTSNLPSSGQTAGDVYNVTATGMNYVWTGSEWDALGEIFTINSMTTTEIDAAFVTAGLTAA